MSLPFHPALNKAFPPVLQGGPLSGDTSRPSLDNTKASQAPAVKKKRSTKPRPGREHLRKGKWPGKAMYRRIKHSNTIPKVGGVGEVDDS